MNILTIVGIATLISTLLELFNIDRDNKKKHEVLGEHEDLVMRGYIEYNGGGNNMNKQTVYKVDGNFNGNIKGDNVTVILMGDGNINGNIESKDGNVVLIKGNINGDVKANKIICPTEPTTNNNAIKYNPAKDVESPKLSIKTLWSCDIPSNNKKCSKCAFARKRSYLSLSGINTGDEYDCIKFNKIVDDDYCCRDFIDLKTIENLNNKIRDIINRK